MFHVIVLLRFILVPNEVPNKSLHNISIAAEFLQKIALAIEHVLFIYIGTTIFTLNGCLMSLKRDIALNGLALTVSF